LEGSQAFTSATRTLNNYEYDDLGNLIKDDAEDISVIEWTVSGKIKNILHVPTSESSDLNFTYDANGNRITKTVIPRDGTGRVNEEQWTTAYYVHDAQGNTLSTYEKTYEPQSQSETDILLHQKEINLYGSDRLGVFERDELISQTTADYAGFDATSGQFLALGNYSSPVITNPTALEDYLYTIRGAKSYELKNHLGNVLAVIADHKKEAQDVSTETTPIWEENFPEKDWYTKGEVELEYGDEGLSAYFYSGKQNIRRPIDASPDNECTFQYCYTLDDDFPQGSLVFKTWDAKGKAVQSIPVTSPSGCVTIDPNVEVELGFRLANLNNGDRVVILQGSLTKICTYSSFSHYEPVVKQMMDYYPFGMQMPGRKAFEGYRYGFNGMERDYEVSGSGNSYTSQFRQYDSRLGRWKSNDPLKANFPWQSPYNGMDNNPIWNTDINGDSTDYFNSKGDLLHQSHDDLENAIVSINDYKLDAFNNALSLATDGSNNEVNTGLRSFGTGYAVDEFKAFFNENGFNQADGYREGYYNEHKTFLYLINGLIRPGRENYPGDPKGVGGEGKDPYDPINVLGDLHFHPNVGLRRIEGGNYTHRPSGPDDAGWKASDSPFHFDVVLTNKYIYFINNVHFSGGIAVPFINTFKKGIVPISSFSNDRSGKDRNYNPWGE
jgi:RHS repeat-associated protein